MNGASDGGPAAVSAAPPDVVVVGAASRDIAARDPRGWRLGGAVTYAALTIANLGLTVRAVIGADHEAAAARELDLLRLAGVEIDLVPLARGPVFENVETPRGRVQRCLEVADAIAPGLPHGAGGARGWFLAPVAGEVPDGWAGIAPAGVPVALGWQGLLRALVPGQPVERRPPAASPLLARANLVGVSRDDLDPVVDLDSLMRLLRPDATLVMTHGRRGGLLVESRGAAHRRLRRYSAIESTRVVDPTGAGDSFLAGLFAARLEPRLVGGRGGGFDLLLAAAVASLVLEGHGRPISRSRAHARGPRQAGRPAERDVAGPWSGPPQGRLTQATRPPPL